MGCRTIRGDVYTGPVMAVNPTQTAGAFDVLGPDPELEALPAPPRRERTIAVTVMLLTTLAAAIVAWSIRGEALYALTPGKPAEVGDLTQLSPRAELANTYVRGMGLLATQGGIRYARPAEGDTFRLAPIAGNEKIWVEIRVPEGFEGPRFIPPGLFAGRLVPLKEAGLRHRGLAGQVLDKTKVSIPDDAWLLVDSSSPRASRWALLVVVMLVAFAAWNGFAVWKILSKVKESAGERDEGEAHREPS